MHKRVHTCADCEALLDRQQRVAGGNRRRPRAFGTRGRAADSCSCWFACRLHLVCEPLDVARNRPLRARMWRVRRPARVLAHVCATARTIDGSARALQRYGVAPVGGAVRVHRLLGIRRQSIRAKQPVAVRLRLAVLDGMACRCIARADAPMRSASVCVRRHRSRRPLRRWPVTSTRPATLSVSAITPVRARVHECFACSRCTWTRVSAFVRG